MADNVTLPGTGETVKTTDVGGLEVQHFLEERLNSGAVLSNVAASASSVTVLAANAARRGAAIFNDSTAILYLKLGAAASTSSFTVQLSAGAYFELPSPCYTGIIDGIWASATGNARVTELT